MMEGYNLKIAPIQEMMESLVLQPREKEDNQKLDRILLGKVINTRVFRKFTMLEIISKTWKLNNKIHVEKIGDNTFKFSFNSKEERERIYQARPWSFNGAHLVLKDWSESKTLKDVIFLTSSFFIQVHGLSLMFLHEGTALVIGKRLGEVNRETINKK